MGKEPKLASLVSFFRILKSENKGVQIPVPLVAKLVEYALQISSGCDSSLVDILVGEVHKQNIPREAAERSNESFEVFPIPDSSHLYGDKHSFSATWS